MITPTPLNGFSRWNSGLPRNSSTWRVPDVYFLCFAAHEFHRRFAHNARELFLQPTHAGFARIAFNDLAHRAVSDFQLTALHALAFEQLGPQMILARSAIFSLVI